MGGRRWKRANTVKDSMGMAIAKPLYSERSKIEVECQGIEVERLHGGKSGSGWTIGAALVRFVSDRYATPSFRERSVPHQRVGPFWSTIFCGSKFTRRLTPSILQLNSTLFSSLAIVSSPDAVFLGKKKRAEATMIPFASRS